MFQRIILICVLLAASCEKKSEPGERKPQILVSIAPYRFLTEQIAGTGFEVQTVVPAAANPHSFEPTARQVAEMGESVVWFRIGEPFEGKILPILMKRNPGLAVQDLRDGVELIADGHQLGCKHCCMDHLDRHIWLSPRLAAVQAALIEKKLSDRFPEQRELFQKNLAALVARLGALDDEIKEILKPVGKRLILVSHPAFGYFCKEYNFEQLSVEYEGKEPRPKHLEEILQRAVAGSMEVALALPQYNNKGAQLIAEKLHMFIHLIDPYSPEYFEMMRKLAHLIADADRN
jgi:zinc transport system substrate-binding protein